MTLAVLVSLPWGVAVGQENAVPPTATEKSPRGGSVEEVKPEVFYLKDRDGNLQAVPGFSFEEFVKLYRLKNQLEQPEAEPHFSLQRMSITGVAESDRVYLTIEFKILVNESGWVKVPLRLTRSVLREAADYQGPGECFVHFDEATGYVAWLRGAAGSEHRLMLKMASPLATLGSGRRLELAAPRATTSHLSLEVPLAHAVATVSQGATLEPAQPADGHTQLSVLGVSSDFVLTWHEPDAQVATVPVVLEVNGAIVTTLDERQVRMDATLSVRSLGGEFDKFRIRLPQGAKLTPGMTATGYKVEPDADEPSRVVQVHLDRKTTGPVDVLLSTQQDGDFAQSDDWLNLAGPEMIDAVQQAGHIAVCVVGDWQVVWGPRRGVRQIDDLPEPLRRKDLAAGFEYFHRAGEPASLPARIVRRKTRLGVEPSYLMLVEKDAVRLEGRLKYSIRGAKVTRLEVEAPGWEIDDVGPRNLVDADEALASEPTRLLIPLQTPTNGELEITFKSHRAIPAGKPIEVQFPRPIADLPGPAEIVVLPDDSVELTPRSEGLVGLIRQLAAPTMKLPERQEEPLVYRGDAQLAKFVADAQTHPQSISVQVTSQVHLGYQANRVEQRLRYRVAYEPIDRVTLEMPRSIAMTGKHEVLVDGQRLSAIGQPEELARNGQQLAHVTYALGRQRIGRLEVAIRYPAPQPRMPTANAGLAVGLVMPTDAELIGNELTVTSEPGMRIEPRDDAWTSTDESNRRAARTQVATRGGTTPLQLSAQTATPVVDFALQVDNVRTGSLTIVERVWIQTWLSEGRRQDRVTLRLTSSEPRVRLKLPTGTVPTEAEVLLDGVALPPTVMPDDDLAVEWPEETPPRPHVLELRYQMSQEAKGPGRLSLESPLIRGSSWIQRKYWQVVLPRNEHVLAESGEWTGEYAWSWHGLGWGRVSLMDQSQLETWSGASHQTLLPEGTNQYVYSSVGPTTELTVWTAGRSLIVLAGSLIVLAAGLLLIYVAKCRHPACFFSAAVVLAAFGLLLPEAAALLAQAGALGAILAVLAAVWARSMSSRRPKGVVVRGGAASSIDRTLSHARIPRPAVLGSHSSTTTEPTGVPVISPEAKP